MNFAVSQINHGIEQLTASPKKGGAIRARGQQGNFSVKIERGGDFYFRSAH